MLQMYDFLIDILYFCINLFITDTKKLMESESKYNPHTV